MRILVVEDDDVIGERLRRALIKEGYSADWAQDGQQGLNFGLAQPYALIILDVMMPKLDGWAVCQGLRDAKLTTPILMLTAKDSIDDRVKGLDLGADDYLVKPFSLKEFLARVRALTRRASVEKSTRISVGNLTLDTRAKTVHRGEELLHLTPREYDLIEALVRNRGRTLSREFIMEQIWDDQESLSNTVNFHVTALRKKLDVGRQKSWIETIHGFGYRLGESESD